MSGLSKRLQDASQSGAYRTVREEALLAAAEDVPLDLARVSLADVRDKGALLAHVAAALGFPRWFGANWDALEDCITDLSWRAARGHLLLIERCDALRSARPDDFGVLLDILRSSAEYWAERGTPFFAVFVDPDHRLALPELSAGEVP